MSRGAAIIFTGIALVGAYLIGTANGEVRTVEVEVAGEPVKEYVYRSIEVEVPVYETVYAEAEMPGSCLRAINWFEDLNIDVTQVSSAGSGIDAEATNVHTYAGQRDLGKLVESLSIMDDHKASMDDGLSTFGEVYSSFQLEYAKCADELE